MNRKKIFTGIRTTAALCVCATLISGPMLSAEGTSSGQWVTGDFHTHTALSDGAYTAEQVAAKAKYYGLDYYSATDHGGLYYADDIYAANRAATVPRSQSIVNFGSAKVAANRSTIMQINGFEWNVPTHEHASVGMIGSNDNAVAQALADFEYQFDAKDTDTSKSSTMSKLNSKADQAIFAAAFLQSKYTKTSYMIPNHTSRQLLWTVADFRDLNDAAPDVAFGAEMLPGHQAASFRGGYNYYTYYDTKAKKYINITSTGATSLDLAVSNYVSIYANDQLISQGKLDDKKTILASIKQNIALQRTYGGADYMLAKVGGTWDALLGEGRNFWIYGNSDFHMNQSKATELKGEADFWPGEYTKNHVNVKSNSYQGYLDGMRSGNSYTVLGDLINALDFKAANGSSSATMGQKLTTTTGKTTTITIRFKSPAKNNANEDGRTGLDDTQTVDHVDLIAGEVTGKIEKYDPSYTGDNAADAVSAAYKNDTNTTTKVIKTFTKSEFKTDSEGYTVVTFTAPATDKNMYYRLRGTNLAPRTAGETDADGNPLIDTDVTSIQGTNTAATAFSDLWFYSNPIYVNSATKSTSTTISTSTTSTTSESTDLGEVKNPHTGNADSSYMTLFAFALSAGLAVFFVNEVLIARDRKRQSK